MTQQADSQATSACSQCGQTFAQSDLVQIAGNWVCGDCKPAFLSRVVAGGISPSQWHYGGFWIRVVARMLDGIILSVVYIPLFLVLVFPSLKTAMTPGRPPAIDSILRLELGYFLALWLILFIYEVPMLRYWGATLGKMALGLKVVRSDGGSLGWGVSCGRYFMYDILTAGIPYLNSVMLLISGIMAGVDTEKRALHDRVCDTRVVYKRKLA